MMPPAQGRTPPPKPEVPQRLDILFQISSLSKMQNGCAHAIRDGRFTLVGYHHMLVTFPLAKVINQTRRRTPPDKMRYWFWSSLCEGSGSRPLWDRLPAYKPNLACRIPNRQVGSWATLLAPLTKYIAKTGKNTSAYNCSHKCEFWHKVQTKSGSCNFGLELWIKLILS